MWLLSDILGLWYMLSKAVTTVVTYLWNFFARKYLLFSKYLTTDGIVGVRTLLSLRLAACPCRLRQEWLCYIL